MPNESKIADSGRTERGAPVRCMELFTAFVEWDKAHHHFLATNSITLYSDGSGTVQNSHTDLFEFHSFEEGIEKLKAVNNQADRSGGQ